jgi:hypothetical protein
LWARGRIEELLRVPGDPTPDSVKAEVTALALTYRLMSPYTSFVAVDDSRVVNLTGTSRTVHQALPLPEGVSFAGIFGKDGPEGLRKVDALEAQPEDRGNVEVDEVEGGVPGGVPGGVVGGGFAALAPPSAPPAPKQAIFSAEFVSDLPVAAGRSGIDLDKNARTTTFSAGFLSNLPVAGRFYQNVLALSPGVQDAKKDGNPNVPGARERKFKTKVGGAASVPERSGERLLDAAFRLLADLADDGKLSAAEGRPALAALLAAQRSSGVIADDVAVHAVATWALAEAAMVLRDDPWVVAARTKALDYLAGLAQAGGWPARPGETVDAEATRWARLVLGSIRAASVTSIPVPKGEPSKRYVQLRSSLASAKSGGTPPVVTGQLPFERLVRSIGRKHLRVVGV